MTNGSHRRAGFLRAPKTGATFFLIAIAMLLGACTTAPAPVSAREPGAADGAQRSSHSSGLAYRDGSLPITIMAPPHVSLQGVYRLGSAEAKIGIVEFSDYQCPYCRLFHDQVLPRIKKEYIDTGIVQFIHKDLPLTSIHPQALPAALAAGCAGAQNRFWPMQDLLYANQEKLAPTLYPKLARALSLDEAKFNACLGDAVREQAVSRDAAEAQALNISGTPSFVIGKLQGNTMTVERVARGAAGFEAFAREIEKLRQPANGVATPITK